jgi:hypothetical protein
MSNGLPWVCYYITARPEGAPESNRSGQGKNRFFGGLPYGAPTGHAAIKKTTQGKPWAFMPFRGAVRTASRDARKVVKVSSL